jgi:hypothetical protein
MKFIAHILLTSFTFMHARCILPQFSFGCEDEKVEMTTCESMCCSKDKSHKPNHARESSKKQCGNEKGCDPATCCICCFALIVEPTKFIHPNSVEPNKIMPRYSTNLLSSYISNSWNPPEMV